MHVPTVPGGSRGHLLPGNGKGGKWAGKPGTGNHGGREDDGQGGNHGLRVDGFEPGGRKLFMAKYQVFPKTLLFNLHKNKQTY